MSNVLLISYDNGSHIPFFPLNLFYLTGALRGAGHDVRILWQDLDHFPDRDITGWTYWSDFKDKQPCDFIGLGFVGGYYQYAKAKSISGAVNRSNRRHKFSYILGGHGPAAAPEWFMSKLGADAVVVGDGERAVVEIVGGGKRGVVQGCPTDSDEAPTWLYPSMQVPFYRLIRWPTSNRTDFCFPILSSRGCKWRCSFCYRMREGFHERDVKAIIDEIRYLHKNFGINHFQFADELLMSSEKRVEEVCTNILRLPFRIKWDCNGRLNFAYPNTLNLMKKSGAEYINYGIESINQSLLNQMGKGLSLEQIYYGVEATLNAGLTPGLNLLWGFPGDTVQNLKEAVKFIKTYDTCEELRTIRPVTPYPGTPLYKKAVEMEKIRDTADFYENLHKNSDLFTVNFMDISTREAHEELYRANSELVMNYCNKRGLKMIGSASGMYLRGEPFRGFRAV